MQQMNVPAQQHEICRDLLSPFSYGAISPSFLVKAGAGVARLCALKSRSIFANRVFSRYETASKEGRRNFSTSAATASVPRAAEVEGGGSTGSSSDISSRKFDLLRAVAGYDRGRIGSTEAKAAAEAAAKALEEAVPAGSVQLTEEQQLRKLDGTWRLVYSSALASGGLGGFRPGPQADRVPLRTGQVFQKVDVAARQLDNVVELLLLLPPWPLPPLPILATLKHVLEVVGPADIRIVYESTAVKVAPELNLPEVSIPSPAELLKFLNLPTDLRSGEFKTTFVDKDMRISRGDRGELRVFVKA
eukprot:TRINITY_DN2692_c0_g1_i1.p1 TRINITY_DN2692_c0_g1~~TRINITY_DN2692_c0_g1_i1.p1  ORF type:complete len:303 (+),score=77.96 TRINITY_DN2692_c0_g1_i1:101-1009(+)